MSPALHAVGDTNPLEKSNLPHFIYIIRLSAKGADEVMKHSAFACKIRLLYYLDGAISREQAAKLKECLQHMDEISAHKKNFSL